MIDKKMSAVVEMLAEQVGYSFKVVKKQQLLQCLPKRSKMDNDTFVAILAYLKENDYITVKYQDKDDICLALTVKSETYLAGEKDMAVKSKIAISQAWLLFLGVFLASFVGAFLAVLLGKLI